MLPTYLISNFQTRNTSRLVGVGEMGPLHTDAESVENRKPTGLNNTHIF